MSGQLILRLDPEQKSKLARLSKAEGKSTSEVLRDLIDQFIRDRDLAGYIDGLWNRIGRKTRGKGFGPGQVQKAIREARKRPK